MKDSCLISIRKIVLCVLIQFAGVAISLGQHQDVTGQSMVGVWQKGTKVMAAVWGDCFLFYPDQTFRFYFRPTQFTENQIIGVRGRYRIKSDSIYFLPVAIEEMVGTKREVIKQVDPDAQAASIREVDGTTQSLSINGVRYYKMREKPEQYFGK